MVEADISNQDQESFDEIDTLLVEWAKSRIDSECKRLQKLGMKPLLLSVKNCSVVVDTDHSPPYLINRIEVDTGYMFSTKIKQLMVSEPIATSKPSYSCNAKS